MTEQDRIFVASAIPLNLARKIVLGTVDVASVGSRVLLSLQPPAGWTVRDVAANITGLQGPGRDTAGPRPVLIPPASTVNTLSPADASASRGRASEQERQQEGGEQPLPAPAVLVRSFYAPAGPGTPAGGDGNGGGTPEVSLVIMNAAIPEDEQAEVAAALADFAASDRHPQSGDAQQSAGQSGPEAGSVAAEGSSAAAPRELYVVAALLLQHLSQPAAIYQYTLNGAAPLATALPPLPAAASASAGSPGARVRVRDGLLAALLHVLEVSGTPACCLLAPGHKPPATTPLDLPDSAATCDALGSALASAVGLNYDAAACRAVRAAYKWFVPEKAAGSDVMYL